METIHRRALLVAIGSAGVVSLAGCLGDDSDETNDEPSLTVTVTNDAAREVAVEVVIAEEGESLDDGELLASFALAVQGDEYQIGPVHDFGRGPHRFGLRIDDGEWEELRHRWRQEECIELKLHIRVRQHENALTVMCRPP